VNRFTRQLIAIANAGYAAYEAGKPRVSPYPWRKNNLTKQRTEHWLAGWDEACRNNPRAIPREPVPARYLNPEGKYPRLLP
jgi:hypothetical protein